MECYRPTVLLIPKQPWRLFRFRISTFLLLVAILAIGLAWYRDHELLSSRLYRLQNPDTHWGVDQATGPPNTSGSGDIVTAWASAGQDDQKEWLVLEYDESVIPKAIVVHETFNPGAVTKVTHYPKWGVEQVLWEGTDPTPVGSGGGVSRLPVNLRTKTNRIKVYIDSPAVPGWNEIDAVGIEKSDGSIIWATQAASSSTYGGRPTQMWRANGVIYVR